MPRRYSLCPDSPAARHCLHPGLRIRAGDHRSGDRGSVVRPGRPTAVARVPGIGMRLSLQRGHRDPPCTLLPRGILRNRLARGERPDDGMALRILARRIPALRPLLCLLPGGRRDRPLSAQTRGPGNCLRRRLCHRACDWTDVPRHSRPSLVADNNPGRQLLASHLDRNEPDARRFERSRAARTLATAQAVGARRMAHGGDERLPARHPAECGRHVYSV